MIGDLVFTLKMIFIIATIADIISADCGDASNSAKPNREAIATTPASILNQNTLLLIRALPVFTMFLGNRNTSSWHFLYGSDTNLYTLP